MLQPLLAVLALVQFSASPAASFARLLPVAPVALTAPVVTVSAPTFDDQAASKLTPPDAAAIEAARAAIEARHAAAFASKSRAKLRRLAEDLRAEVPDAAPVEQYALLLEVERIALEAREGALAIEAVRLRLAGWELDELGVRAALLERFAERGNAPKGDDVSVFLDFAFETGELALQHAATTKAEEDWAFVEATVGRIDSVIDQAEDDVTSGDMQRRAELGFEVERAVEFRTALAALRETPLDGAINEVIGWYHFAVLGDVAGSVRYLMRSSDPEIEKAARYESGARAEMLLESRTNTAMVAAANQWAECAEQILKAHAKPRLDAMPFVQAQRALAALRTAQDWLTRALEIGGYADLEEIWRRNLKSISGRIESLEPLVALGPMPFGPAMPRPEPTDKQRGAAVDAAVVWLLAHQDPSGAWRSTTFDADCTGCEGTTETNVDVGATALAMLALLAQANAPECGDVEGALERAGNWLIAQQNPKSGKFEIRVPPGTEAGAPATKSSLGTFHYQQALAIMALAEWQRVRPNGATYAACELATRVIQRSRNYASAWRYTEPGNGQNDTSVTGLMVAALCACREVGVEFDGADDALAGAVNWIDEARDEETGRVGYDEKGGLSARLSSTPTLQLEGREAMTAIGLKVYSVAGTKAHAAKLKAMVELIGDALPVAELGDTKSKTRKYGPDFYYYYHGTEALTILAAAGNRDAKKVLRKWDAELEDVLLGLQMTEGHAAGSWAPNGPWGEQGGRIYSTALAVLALSTEWRNLPMAQSW